MTPVVSQEGMSILVLVRDASVVVQLVLLLLLLASLVSWTMIFRKRAQLRAAQVAAEAFEARFWAGANLAQMYQELNQRGRTAMGMESIFLGGFREYSRLNQQPGVESGMLVEGVHRAMRVALSRELDALELNLPFLATVGSTSPYVGLFGTVWGIMNSFRSLGGMQQATIAHVAPGIAEALVATAMGLLAAIPAVIAYNRYSSAVERLATRYENFMEEFASILQRQALAKGA